MVRAALEVLGNDKESIATIQEILKVKNPPPWQANKLGEELDKLIHSMANAQGMKLHETDDVDWKVYVIEAMGWN